MLDSNFVKVSMPNVDDKFRFRPSSIVTSTICTSCFQVFGLLSYMLKYVKSACRSIKFLKVSFLEVSYFLINASSRIDLHELAYSTLRQDLLEFWQ